MFFKKAEELGISVPELIDQIRAQAIASHVSDEVKQLCKRHGVFVPVIRPELASKLDALGASWLDWKWHLRNRLTSRQFDKLIELFPECNGAGMEEYLRDEYDLSILPVYLSLGLREAVNYVLPVADYRSKVDPYAIKHQGAVIKSRREDGDFYVATRKPQYGTYLLTLTVPWAQDATKGTFFCPLGCRSCYRGIETRSRQNLRITDTHEQLQASRVRQQAEALVKHWSPEVYDLLVSGGEPLMFSNQILREEIMEVVDQCPNLHSFRICTGALGLGLFSRFDEELIEILVGFRQRTGIQVGINAHLAHPENFTPEMIQASLALKRNNIRIMPQVPLVEGTNFFGQDLPRTVSLLRRLCRLSSFTISEPVYKFIVDMQGSVSLLSAIRVYRALIDRHQIDSNIVRPVSFELFVAGAMGNVNLSYHTLFAMEMEVNMTNGLVTYHIPHAAGGVIDWTEPLQPDINDDSRLLQKAIKEEPIG